MAVAKRPSVGEDRILECADVCGGGAGPDTLLATSGRGGGGGRPTAEGAVAVAEEAVVAEVAVQEVPKRLIRNRSSTSSCEEATPVAGTTRHRSTHSCTESIAPWRRACCTRGNQACELYDLRDVFPK